MIQRYLEHDGKFTEQSLLRLQLLTTQRSRGNTKQQFLLIYSCLYIYICIHVFIVNVCLVCMDCSCLAVASVLVMTRSKYPCTLLSHPPHSPLYIICYILPASIIIHAIYCRLSVFHLLFALRCCCNCIVMRCASWSL